MDTITTTEQQRLVNAESKDIQPAVGLTLNIIEIIPSKDRLTIFSTPFSDHVLKEYRKKFL